MNINLYMLFYNNLEKKFGIAACEVFINGVKVKKSSSEFEEFKKEKFEELRKKYILEALKDNSLVRCYRDFYWRIGIDPTKQRPSAEALLRRVLAGKDLPSINNVVDSYNLASILTLVPMGAYDAAKLRGELRIRYSNDESFVGIGGASYKTSNEIVIADDEKILCIYPYRDSDVTKVTEATKGVVIVLCGVAGVSQDYLRESANTTLELVTRFCGGEERIV
jgi:DNA/RNA-binding domain of Phe-tRNA-synthetase-like protein